MSNESSSNRGEGNPEAAERFNTAERQFVNSDSGRRKIKQGAQVHPGEEAELAKAEQAGRAHAKDDDSESGAKLMRSTSAGRRDPEIT
jgi:hypothetical protein